MNEVKSEGRMTEMLQVKETLGGLSWLVAGSGGGQGSI